MKRARIRNNRLIWLIQSIQMIQSNNLPHYIIGWRSARTNIVPWVLVGRNFNVEKDHSLSGEFLVCKFRVLWSFANDLAEIIELEFTA